MEWLIPAGLIGLVILTLIIISVAPEDWFAPEFAEDHMSKVPNYLQQGGVPYGVSWQGYPPLGRSPHVSPGVVGRIAVGPRRVEEEAPPRNDGFAVGELEGHRCWFIHNGLLRSFSANCFWAPDEPMTEESGVQSIEGSGKGGIGIHAFKLQRQALQFAMDWSRSATSLSPSDAVPIIYGRVKLWGEVVEHDLGYRAQYARVCGIDGVFCGQADVDALRKRYKVAAQS